MILTMWIFPFICAFDTVILLKALRQVCLILLLERHPPAEFSCSNTPTWMFLLSLKTLISCFRCIKLFNLKVKLCRKMGLQEQICTLLKKHREINYFDNIHVHQIIYTLPNRTFHNHKHKFCSKFYIK